MQMANTDGELTAGKQQPVDLTRRTPTVQSKWWDDGSLRAPPNAPSRNASMSSPQSFDDNQQRLLSLFNIAN